MMSTLQVVAAVLFVVAIVHTFSTKYFEQMARRDSAHAGVWRVLGEVEVVFSVWSAVLMLVMSVLQSKDAAVGYLNSLNYTEPMFVFVIMVIAASKPVLQFCLMVVNFVARLLPLPATLSFYFVVLFLVPLFGSFITEPAAMTLAAFMLRDRIYSRGISSRLQYVTLGVLFVNVSIGGTLTSYAAPPILMVAGKWGWDSVYMLTHFGWRSVAAAFVNTVFATVCFRRELCAMVAEKTRWCRETPLPLMMVHLLFLLGAVMYSHESTIFMALFLFFLCMVSAYKQFQDSLILREGLLVGFFLAGLVTLGSMQQWWLQIVLQGMSDTVLYFGATALTAVTDNAALTYLGSLVHGIDDGFKYALVAGAVTGGGLTVIANAPNPVGFSVLKSYFDDQAIHPGFLFLAALFPTVVAVCAFWLV